jgi:hypothetical protein
MPNIMTPCKSVKYTDGVEFILDLIDDYLDIKEAVEWDEKKGEDHDKQNL